MASACWSRRSEPFVRALGCGRGRLAAFAETADGAPFPAERISAATGAVALVVHAARETGHTEYTARPARFFEPESVASGYPRRRSSMVTVEEGARRTEMSITDWFRAPLWLAGLAGTSKSFRQNPLIGNPRLNERGLHLARVDLARRMAERRRSVLGRALAPELRQRYDEDGFILLENYLPDAAYEALIAQVRSTPLPAHEMRQGQTVTRMIPLGPGALRRLTEARRVVRDRQIADMMRYTAAANGPPVWSIQTVFADPDDATPDPQSDLHADTFHSTAKAWFFLQDVGEDDGPFAYVPGSHRPTPERLAWEYETSLTARDDPRLHHSLGSFRVRPHELEAMGLGPARRVTVKANTLVVADTFGFHARTPSVRRTRRMELHGYLRLAPFSPFAFPALRSLPGIAERQLDIYVAQMEFERRVLGRPTVWMPVGSLTADAPAVR